MSDTPDLEEALADASSTLKDENFEETQNLTPNESTEGETTDPDTSTQPDGEEDTEGEGKAEQTEDTFLDKPLSLDEVPAELKGTYKHWQKQYTEKRQAEKAELAALKQKVSELESRQTEQPRLLLNQQQTQETKGMTPEQLEKYLDVREQNHYIQTQEEKFFGLDTRLVEDSPDYDPILFFGVTGKIATERDQFEKEHGTVNGFDFVGKAKELIAQHDSKIKKQGGEFIKQKTEQSKQMLDKSRKENPNAKNVPGKTSKALDLDDSIDLAFSKIPSS